MRCVRQYFRFLNHHFARQVEERHHLQARIPLEVLILISELCADSHGIVIDNGTGYLRAGFVGDDAPRSRFENLVSTYHVPKDRDSAGDLAFWIANDVPGNLSHRTKRFEYRPIVDRGVISNWDDMERIWKHAFANELRVDPADHPVLLTEPPVNPKAARERVAKIMFQSFGVPALYLSVRSLLSLFAAGRTTGCVLHSGYAVTNVVPIYEGHVLHHAVVSLDLGGRDLHDYLEKLIYARGIAPLGNMSKSSEREVIGDIKNSVCFVSMDFQDDMRKSAASSVLERRYEIFNGTVLTLGNERFCCPEALFQPDQMGLECDGIAASTVQAIEACADDIEVKKTMYSNIVLCGGNTLFPGFSERLTKEINDSLALGHQSFRIDPLPKPRYENREWSWIGGSILASMPQFQLRMWITSEEYREFGPSIIHQDRLNNTSSTL